MNEQEATQRTRDLNRLAEIMRSVRATPEWTEAKEHLIDEAIGIHHRIEIECAERRSAVTEPK